MTPRPQAATHKACGTHQESGVGVTAFCAPSIWNRQFESTAEEMKADVKASGAHSEAYLLNFRSQISQQQSPHYAFSTSELQLVLEAHLGAKGSELACSFAKAEDEPPITAESLSELNIDHISKNLQLRHDVNFDRELHFRPNVDCSRGKQKINRAKLYWEALVAELELYTLINNTSPQFYSNVELDLNHAVREPQRRMLRMPRMFERIKGILYSILPVADHAQIGDVLDVPVLMQQIHRGACDFIGLSKWLAKLLKTHCAPMRDEWVDKMVSQMENGAKNGSAKSIVDGLRELFGVLEAMKLDVANHQIRNLRTYFVEHTVSFEQCWYHDNPIDVRPAKTWFNDYSKAPQLQNLLLSCGENPSTKLAPFVYAFLRSLLSPKAPSESFPDTFRLDLPRLNSLRADLIDQIHLQICLEVFNGLLKRTKTSPLSSNNHSSLHQCLLIIAGARPPQQDPSVRWLSNIPNLAAHLLRTASPNLPLHHLDTIERSLATHLPPHSAAFAQQAERLLPQLFAPLLATVAVHADASPIALSNAFVPAASSSKLARTPAIRAGLDGKGLQEGGGRTAMMEGRAKLLRDRMAHLVVLHWRMWAPAAYLVGEEVEARARDEVSKREEEEEEKRQREEEEPGGVWGKSCGSEMEEVVKDVHGFVVLDSGRP